MDRTEILAILAAAGQRPQHQFGQNFMLDQNFLHALVDAGQIQPHDILLEVGPGVGNLTRLLSQRAAQGAVLAVDIDKKLLPATIRHHPDLTNVHWLNADVLAGKHHLNPDVLQKLHALQLAHPAGSLKLVSNLPYNAASPLIAELLVHMHVTSQSTPQNPLLFSRLVFTVQWEVAQRMHAAPNTRDYGPLGILIQLLADVEILRKIPPGAFWPPPKVHSALVAVTPRPDRFPAVTHAVTLQKLLAGLFSHRRQTLNNALKHYLDDSYTPTHQQLLLAANIPTSLRPENLTPAQFLTLAQILNP